MRTHHNLHITFIGMMQREMAGLRVQMGFLKWKTITLLVTYEQISFPQLQFSL